MRLTYFAAPAALAACLASAVPAFAVDVGGGLNITGGATLVSDYRFRGISLSDEDPAIQGTLNFNHESGFYAGAWGSSLADTLLYGEVELDLYAGWRREVAGGTTLDVGLLYYFYPAGSGAAGSSDFAEPYASISHTFGPVTAKVGAAYAWSQIATGNGDNLYLYTDWSGAVPGTPVTLRAHLGHSEGSLSLTGDYLDWALGADFALGSNATIGISYVDTDLGNGPAVDQGVVLSLGFSF